MHPLIAAREADIRSSIWLIAMWVRAHRKDQYRLNMHGHLTLPLSIPINIIIKLSTKEGIITKVKMEEVPLLKEHSTSTRLLKLGMSLQMELLITVEEAQRCIRINRIATQHIGLLELIINQELKDKTTILQQ